MLSRLARNRQVVSSGSTAGWFALLKRRHFTVLVFGSGLDVDDELCVRVSS